MGQTTAQFMLERLVEWGVKQGFAGLCRFAGERLRRRLGIYPKRLPSNLFNFFRRLFWPMARSIERRPPELRSGRAGF